MPQIFIAFHASLPLSSHVEAVRAAATIATLNGDRGNGRAGVGDHEVRRAGAVMGTGTWVWVPVFMTIFLLYF